MFDQAQIAEFKEAFAMIDQDCDGFITKDDLNNILTNMGKDPSDSELDAMIAEAPGTINFTMFLTLFGEKMSGTDADTVINNAFACFDDNGDGTLGNEQLRELMLTMGDRLTEEEADDMFYAAKSGKCIDGAKFDYKQFTKVIKGMTEGTADDAE